MTSYQNFKSQWLGKRVDYDHVYAYQCVDLIQQFMYECAGVGGGVYGNAIDYANKPSAAFSNAVIRVTDGSKIPGDIIVLGPTPSNSFGHIALRDDNVDMMLEQNAATGSGSGTGRDAIGVYRNIPYNRVVAVYRIKQFIPAPPPPPPAPAPAPAPKPANRYEKLAAPLDLVVNKSPTNVWDLGAQKWPDFKFVAQLNNGTPFTAVGKYKHPLGGVYFMDANSFGNADQDGNPSHNQGINTVDLSPAPAPAEAPKPAPKPSEETKVEVKVNTFKDSYQANPGKYKAIKDITIKDLEGLQPDVKLGSDMVVHRAGMFTKDGIEYARTEKSVQTNVWYGIPLDDLIPYATTPKGQPKGIVSRTYDEIDKLAEEVSKDPDFTRWKNTLSPRAKLTNAVGQAEEKVSGFFHKFDILKNKKESKK